MKLSSTLLLAATTAGCLPTAAAFVPHTTKTLRSETCVFATGRRDFFGAAAAAAAAVVLAPTLASAEPRPMYLTEPTDDFKENEAKSAEFKRQQLLLKKELVAALEKLTGEANDSDALVKDLKDVQAIIAKTGGLPLGIKKDDLVKMVRSKKAKGFWPTPVEVAYQSVINEIAFQQSPNLEKDLGNFYQ